MAAIADSASFRNARYRQDLARRLGLTGFFHWWARELAAAMPARLRAAFEHRRARPVLAFDGSRATLYAPAQVGGRVQMSEVAQISLYAEQDVVAAGGRAALAPLARAANGAAPEIVVALPARASLRKMLTLPAAIEDNLHQALAYDLDRHTPFRADELYFDAAIVDRDAARNTLQVDLAAARRAIVDPMLRHAENFGARVVAVTVDPPPSAASSQLNLLPEDRRNGAAAWTRWQIAVPATLLVIGILAALVLPVWQKREAAIALNQQSDEARQRATVSDALRTELERKVGDYNFALERKYAFPGAVQVLDDITRILPDDTWLTQLELRAVRGKDGQRELTLRGESANAGRLVSLLEESKLFTQTAPRSPTTKIQPGPGEIFDVGAQLKPLAPPPAAPLDVTARPAPVAATPPRAPVTTTAPAAGRAASPAPAAGGAAASTAGTAGSAAPANSATDAASAVAPPAPSSAGVSRAPATAATPSGRATAARPAAVPRSTAPLAPAVDAAATGVGPAASVEGATPAPLEPPAPDAEETDGEGNPQ